MVVLNTANSSFSVIRNSLIPLFCSKWREYKIAISNLFVIISYSLKLTKEEMRVCKILKGCFSRFHTQINSSRLIINLQYVTSGEGRYVALFFYSLKGSEHGKLSRA